MGGWLGNSDFPALRGPGRWSLVVGRRSLAGAEHQATSTEQPAKGKLSVSLRPRRAVGALCAQRKVINLLNRCCMPGLPLEGISIISFYSTKRLVQEDTQDCQEFKMLKPIICGRPRLAHGGQCSQRLAGQQHPQHPQRRIRARVPLCGMTPAPADRGAPSGPGRFQILAIGLKAEKGTPQA
jgi:hypothetical protein